LTHRIYVTEDRIGGRGPEYSATYNGETIVERCTTGVIFEAARQLQARGITGWLEMWDHERPYPRMHGEIDHLALWMIVERSKGVITREKYRPPPPTNRGRTPETTPEATRVPENA
jgi:hypothetical protein